MLLEPSIIEELSPSPGIMPLSLLSPPNAELPSAIDELEEDEDDEELGLLLEELDESSLPQQPVISCLLYTSIQAAELFHAGPALAPVGAQRHKAAFRDAAVPLFKLEHVLDGQLIVCLLYTSRCV